MSNLVNNLDELITPQTINFTELVKNSSTTLSLNVQTKMINMLTKEFTEEEQQWYIANLYVYMNYHPTEDYPINLETVYKMIGFANKGNAMKTIKNNFTEGEDYKVVIFRMEKNLEEKDVGGRPTETVMLNVDTFKNLCMLAKTEKGKAIRKYYLKLENLYNQIIKEEIDEKQNLLENAKKLLEEKDKYIAQLKEQETSLNLYIGHNPIIKNVHKIGIFTTSKTNDVFVRQENHKSSNPQFEYLFTYESNNAKLIEDLLKLILKPFKLNKPEWFNISYERIKQVVDFVIMIYDDYHINDSTTNLIEFISRYRSNRLINTNKARVLVSKNIYEEWFYKNAVMIPGAKISTELICNDFYEWYKENYSNHFVKSHIKLDTGHWSTAFQKEITKTISEITNLSYKTKISFTDRKRGIYFPKCAGFIGFELKSMMNKKVEFFDKSVYETYINEFITITNDPRNKVARKEILDDFLIWVKNNNFISKNKIMCRTAISSVFKDVLIENIENITGLKIKDVCKLTYFGCFVGMIHKNFSFTGYETPEKEIQSNSELIKKQVSSWLDIKNITKIARIFKKCFEQTYISEDDVKSILESKHNHDITLNTRKTHWHLVFYKDQHSYYIKEEALNYAKEISII